MELKISIKSYFESKESSSRVFFRAAGELQWKCSKKKKVFLLETILLSKYHLLEWTLPYIYIYIHMKKIIHKYFSVHLGTEFKSINKINFCADKLWKKLYKCCV